MAEELAPHSILPESWSVKEVVADLKKDLITHLDKQDGVLREISIKVDSKADKADLQSLVSRFDIHGERISSLEQHHLDGVASRQFHNRVWTVVGSAIATLAIAAGAIAAFVHP